MLKKHILGYYSLFAIGFLVVCSILYQSPKQVLGASTPTFVQANESFGTQTSATLNTTAGNMLLVACSSEAASSGSFTVPTDSAGDSFVYSGISADNSGWSDSARLYYALNISARAGNIVTCHMGSPSYPDIAVAEYSGIALSAALDTTASAISNTGNTITSSAYTTSQASELIVTYVRTNGSNSPTAPNLTPRISNSPFNIEDQIVSTTQTNRTDTLTGTSGNAVMVLAAFKASGSGSPTPTPTATPTGSPTPTPTVTPTPTPTPTGTPTPTPSGTNMYIAQFAAGSGNGSSCANALAVGFFNTSANWAASPTSGKISPGTIVHLCGTFTGGAGSNMLTAQGSGSSGNPITIFFEPGAVLTAPYWGSSNGAIEISNQSYIVIDGGTTCGYINGAQVPCNGTIRNTANGRTLTYSQQSKAIHAEPCNNCEVKNMYIQDLYIQSYQAACAGSVDNYEVSGVKFKGSNFLIHNNIFKDIGNAMWDNAASGDSGASMYNNDMYNTEVDIIFAPNGTFTVGTTKIYNNHFHDWSNWDRDLNDPTCYHHNGIHAFSGTSTQGPSVLAIYNNLFDGPTSTHGHMTGWIYLEGGDSTFGGSTGSCYVFNNVGVMSPGTTGGWMSSCSDGHNNIVANNTLVGAAGVQSLTIGQYLYGGTNGTGQRFTNNALSGVFTYLAASYDSSQVTEFVPGGLDYNIYGDGSGAGDSHWIWRNHGISTSVFGTWKSNCALFVSGCESHSIDRTSITDPVASLGVNSAGFPQTGSPLLNAAANLSSLCSGDLLPLCSDIRGVARPTTGAWDIGAYQVSSGSGGGTPLAGDLNLDHIINALDYSIMNAHWLQNFAQADINSDGLVNSIDFAVLKSNWGKTW